MPPFSPPPVASLDAESRLLLRAARSWVIIACRRTSPRSAMEAMLGTSAGRFGQLMEQITCAWPEPFTTYPPCACAQSPDEATLLALLRHAANREAHAFHRHLYEMLPLSVRERLWHAASAVAADWIAAP